MNQARFAVSAMRRPSLTHAADAATHLLSAQSCRTGYSDIVLICPHAASPHKARTSADVPDSALPAGREQSSPALNSGQCPARCASGLRASPFGFRGLRKLNAQKRFPLAAPEGSLLLCVSIETLRVRFQLGIFYEFKSEYQTILF